MENLLKRKELSREFIEDIFPSLDEMEKSLSEVDMYFLKSAKSYALAVLEAYENIVSDVKNFDSESIDELFSFEKTMYITYLLEQKKQNILIKNIIQNLGFDKKSKLIKEFKNISFEENCFNSFNDNIKKIFDNDTMKRHISMHGHLEEVIQKQLSLRA